MHPTPGQIRRRVALRRRHRRNLEARAWGYLAGMLARYIYGHQAAGTDSPSSGGHFAVVPLPSLDAPRYRADGRLRHVALIGYSLDLEPARELHWTDRPHRCTGSAIQNPGAISKNARSLPCRNHLSSTHLRSPHFRPWQIRRLWPDGTMGKCPICAYAIGLITAI